MPGAAKHVAPLCSDAGQGVQTVSAGQAAQAAAAGLPQLQLTAGQLIVAQTKVGAPGHTNDGAQAGQAVWLPASQLPPKEQVLDQNVAATKGNQPTMGGATAQCVGLRQNNYGTTMTLR